MCLHLIVTVYNYKLKHIILLAAINSLTIANTIFYDGKYFEVNNLVENQYIGGQNPETMRGGDAFGSNHSIILTCHLTRRNVQNLERVRSGNSSKGSNIYGEK